LKLYTLPIPIKGPYNTVTEYSHNNTGDKVVKDISQLGHLYMTQLTTTDDHFLNTFEYFTKSPSGISDSTKSSKDSNGSCICPTATDTSATVTLTATIPTPTSNDTNQKGYIDSMTHNTKWEIIASIVLVVFIIGVVITFYIAMNKDEWDIGLTVFIGVVFIIVIPLVCLLVFKYAFEADW
jgi:hypothetical protein